MLRWLWIVAVAAAALVVLHQLVVDSPLFELGAEYWFPGVEDGVALGTALRRLALAGVVPGLALAGAVALVLAAPFRVWLWGVVGAVAVTVVVSPLLEVRQLGCRPPTAPERERLSSVPGTDGVTVCVVDDARDGPINGYAVGGPFGDVVGVSRFSLSALDDRQLGAVLAHELGHHRLRHVLLRDAASLAWLAAGAAVLTALFAALTPAAFVGLVVLVGTERLLSLWVLRRNEYAADAFAARRTSPAAVIDLLESLHAAVGVEQESVPRFERALSTHPTYPQRVARLRRAFDEAAPARSQRAPAAR